MPSFSPGTTMNHLHLIIFRKSQVEGAEEVGKGELLWPLRVALSGRERSPDPFTIAFIIGRVETLDRIRLACDKIGE